jgi:hypothetical protein
METNLETLPPVIAHAKISKCIDIFLMAKVFYSFEDFSITS